MVRSLYTTCKETRMSIVLDRQTESSWNRARQEDSRPRGKRVQPTSFGTTWNDLQPFIALAIVVGIIIYLYLG
jgi:hypothetical protein